MGKKVKLDDISIRTELRPGDIGYIIYLHGSLYNKEYGYSISLETYVAEGLTGFVNNYNHERDRVWICEHDGKIIGSLLLMHRDMQTAQLRYFIISPEYRGIGLGKKLMSLFMEFFHECGYSSSYLWTTHELPAAASLYRRYGFKLTEEKVSTAFGKELREQRYDLKKLSSD